MILHFLKLEWKQYFRSSYWGKGLALKILMVFFALYFIISFLSIGIGGYYILKKEFPDQDPLQLVNSFLAFAILGDLIFRYLMQKLPVMNIKPLLILPIKKSKLVHYVLGKSAFSFFNFMSLFFYIPFSIVLVKEGYNSNGILGWFFAIFFIIQVVNFLNFLINKSNIAFWAIALLTAGLVAAQKFQLFDVTVYSQQLFDAIVANPLLAVIPLIIAGILYYINYLQLRTKVYLDDAVATKTKEANSVDLSWANRLGDVAPFIKNDIRLIWRNKRTKTVFLMSFLFLFYGLIFFDNPIYREKMPAFLLFAALFVTGGFTINYGQFIPAWDSSHYKLLMSQNIRYRKFLESKWFLMVAMTTILYLLSMPYLYYGIDIFLMITAGAIFNIGFNSLFLLYAGSFNRKRIDLNKSGFSNMQGTSATQFLIIIPLMILPILLYWGFNTLIGQNAGLIAVATTGVICLLFKNYFMDLIEKKYLKDKYATIHAFEQKS
tara:strand:+ start:315208 stop:316677 length:1470 start_codon:yes stop_codon:yes gene_type:complete